MNEKRRLARLCLKALFYPCRAEPMPAAVAVVAQRADRWSPQPATGNTASGGRHQSSGVKPRSALPCIYIIHNHNRPIRIHLTTDMEWKDHPASWHICHSLLTLFISIIKCIQHVSIKNFCNSRNQILWLPQANPLSCSATITIHQVHFRIFNAQ